MVKTSVTLGTAAIALCLIAGQPAIALDPTTAMAKCAAIKSIAERGACYDDLAKSLDLDKPAVQITKPAGPGKWTIQTETSPIDDSTSVFISLEGNQSLSAWPGKSVKPTLVARCLEGHKRVYVVTGMTDAGDETRVRYRLDKEKAVSGTWSNSKDQSAVFFPGQDISFLKQLMVHSILYFEITPFESNPTASEFDLSGLEQASKPLQDACKWQQTSKPAPLATPKTNAKPPSVSNQARPASPPPAEAPTALPEQGVLQSDEKAILDQVQNCWNILAGGRDAANFIIDLRVRFNPDGSLQAPPIVISNSRMSDPFYRSAAEAARRAVIRCEPYRLPNEKFLNQDVVLHLDPKEMFGR
jgi:type VI secretion system protein VasI